MAILSYGQVGWRSAVATPSQASSLWTSVYGVWNADNTANDAVSTNHGTLVNGASFTTGKIGQAFSFDGVDDYVSLGDNIFNSFTSDFSISGWINLNSVSGNRCILSNLSYNNSNGISNGWMLLMRNNVPYFEIYTNSGIYDNISSSSNLNTSTWYHVVITRKASTRSRMYINGSLVVANASSLNPTYVTTSIPIPSSIGAWKYNASSAIMYLNGKVDALNVWNRELTAADVTDLYNAGTGKQYPTT